MRDIFLISHFLTPGTPSRRIVLGKYEVESIFTHVLRQIAKEIENV
jgi:hypothetical protein